MGSNGRLDLQLKQRASACAETLTTDGTTVVVTYGGGPANQYGLESSGAAIVEELTARGVSALQIPANSDQGFDQLTNLNTGAVVVWVTDPYRFTLGPDGGVVRSDLRTALKGFGLPIVSQSQACSAATLYKDQTSDAATAAGLRTIPAVRVARAGGDVDQALQFLAANHLVIAKPIDGDEGQGVCLVNSEAQLLASVASIHNQGSDALVEIYTSGTEVGVPVLTLGPGELVALPAVEAWADGGVIDHQVKTTPGALHLFTPPRDIDPPVLDHLGAQAVALASRLDAIALLRVDFIVDRSGTIWFLEANSFPGLSPTGLAMASLTTLDLTRGDLALLVVSSIATS